MYRYLSKGIIVMRKILSLALSLVILCGMFAVPASAADYSIKADSPLKGVDVGFYGDSICAANCEKNTSLEYVRGWAGRIGHTNDMDWENHGVGGASVSTIRGENTIYAQLENSDFYDYEMIILHGGTNDAWSGAPVGRMTEPDEFDSSDSYETGTFAGGLEQIFAYIRENNPDAVVGYIINFKFIASTNGVQVQIPDGNGGTITDYQLRHMEKYVETTKEICDKWEIPYLDLYSDDELTNKLHPVSGNGYATTYLSDFVHPNTAGYDLLAPYIEEFMIDILAASQETEAVTTVATAPATAPTTVPETTVPETAETKPGGCGAFMGSSAVVIVSAIGVGAALLRKRKEK